MPLKIANLRAVGAKDIAMCNAEHAHCIRKRVADPSLNATPRTRVSSGSSCQSLDAVVIGRSHAALLMSNPGKALVSKNTAESEEHEEEEDEQIV